MATILGIDALAVFAAVVWFSAWLMLALQAIYTRREFHAFMASVKPLLEKADAAMTSLPDLGKLADLEMIPGTIVHGIKAVLQEQLETPGSPLRKYTSAFITEGTSALEEIFAKRMEPLSKILPAASTILSKSGVEGRMDKAEGRAVVEAMLEKAGPLKGTIMKYLPKSALDDPVVFMNTLASYKKTISAFAPQIGAQIDSAIEQMFLSGEESAPGPAGLVKFIAPGAAQSSSAGDGYGR